MAVDYAIHGLDPVLKKMRGLAPALRKKAINQALRKGMVPVRNSAIAAAKRFDDPKTAQSIPKEIVIRSNAKKARRMGSGVFLVQVGVRGGAKAYVDSPKNRASGRAGQTYEGGGNVWHWRLLELGTSEMRAQPFMRPAISENIEKVIGIVVIELNRSIDKIIASGQR